MFWENLDVAVYAITNYQTCQTDTNDYTMFLIKLDSVFRKQLQVEKWQRVPAEHERKLQPKS